MFSLAGATRCWWKTETILVRCSVVSLAPAAIEPCAVVSFFTPGLSLEAFDLVSTLVLLSTVAPVLLSTLLLVLLSTVAPLLFSTLLLVLLSIVAFDLLSTLPGAFSPFVGLFSDFSSPFSSDEAPVVSCFWTCAALGAFFSPAFI